MSRVVRLAEPFGLRGGCYDLVAFPRETTIFFQEEPRTRRLLSAQSVASNGELDFSREIQKVHRDNNGLPVP